MTEKADDGIGKPEIKSYSQHKDALLIVELLSLGFSNRHRQTSQKYFATVSVISGGFQL